MLVFHGNGNNGTNEMCNRHQVSGWDNKLPLGCMWTTWTLIKILKEFTTDWDLRIDFTVATHAIRICVICYIHGEVKSCKKCIRNVGIYQAHTLAYEIIKNLRHKFPMVI